MIEYIKQKANRIEDDLWDLAKSAYGLERTIETVARINASAEARFRDEAIKGGLSYDPESKCDGEMVESSLALSFILASLVHAQESPYDALDALIHAAQNLGAMRAHLQWKGVTKEAARHITLPNMAQAMARKRHAENRSIASDALNYWRQSIDPKLSAAKAANELVRVVPWHVERHGCDCWRLRVK